MVALMGCAGTQEFREGNELLAAGRIEQGLSKLEEAVQLNPRNAEFRIALANRRTSSINQLIASGDSLRREGRLSDAEKVYRQVQTLDPGNAMARQQLDVLSMERRHRQVLADAEALLKKGSATDFNEALKRIRTVLSENPNQMAALNLKGRVDEALSKTQKPGTALGAAFKKPISLEFHDASLKSVFDLIAKVAGLNFYFDKDIRPDLKATVFAKNTSIEDTLRLLLMTNQLQHEILNENSILIYPNTPQKQKDYQALSVRMFYLANADVKAVSNSIKTIVKTKDMVIDERLGVIILRDTPEAIRVAEQIVALQDMPDPEVMLEVEILEIKRSRLMELGIQWPSQLTLAPLQTTGTPLTLDALSRIGKTTLQATIGNTTINARKEGQDGNILANPRIRVRNKDKAKIQIGDRVPVITTTSTSTGFVAESVSYVDVGLKLEVEPNIYLDQEVAIKINLEVSNLVREVLSKSGTLSYQIGTRGANTVLRLKDGETQILAGLISDEDRSTANKMPGLGELPILGRLFGSQKDDTTRSEILLSITPHILRSIRRPALSVAEFESGTESYIGTSSMHLGTVTDAGGDKATPEAPPQTRGKPAVTAAPVPVSGTPVADTAVIPDATPNSSLSFSWQAPAQVKVGEQFSAVLRVSSQGAMTGLPLLVGFDPQQLQVVGVQEGNFLRQNAGATSFNHRIDAAQGKVFVAAVRQNSSGTDAGVNGLGTAITVNFAALKPTGATATSMIQLLSVTPEPTTSGTVALPVEHRMRILP